MSIIGTRQWGKLRKYWSNRLPMNCIRCGKIITPEMEWDLDHPISRALGGTDADARPAHRRCNRQAGGELKARLARRRDALRPKELSAPSRPW